MGVLASVGLTIGTTKERGTQLYFRDDGGFIFRKLDIEDGFLVLKDKNSKVIKAWLMRYKLLHRFDGYKNIGADKVTVSFGRDIMFDPFKLLNPNEAPVKGDDLQKLFIRKIATAKCYKHEHEAKGSNVMDRLQVVMGVTIVLLAVGLLLKAAF